MENKKIYTNNKKQKYGVAKDNKIEVKPIPIEKVITDWFYMTPNEVTAKMISNLIKLHGDMQVDFWEEMNIFQLELSNNMAVEFEPIKIDFKDPSDEAFIKDGDIKTIFAFTMEEETYEEVKLFIRVLFAEWGGFICADSDDFKPLYGEDDL